METWEWVVLGIGVGVVVVLALAFLRIRWRRSQLKTRFGSEYEHEASRVGTGAAEKRLAHAERTHEELVLRTLPNVTRERYLDEWRLAEARFVSDPGDAVRAAERIVERLLEERGYPSDGDADDRLVLIAVDHPDVVERYRHAHETVDESAARQTEDLRRAMVDFRSVLEGLLQGEPTLVA
jgi:hypothetical protein